MKKIFKTLITSFFLIISGFTFMHAEVGDKKSGKVVTVATQSKEIVEVIRPVYEKETTQINGTRDVSLVNDNDMPKIHFMNPLKEKFYITSLFGPRLDPFTSVPSNHNGVDMACSTGTPIYAVLGGVVEVSGWHKSYGNYIIIRHNGGYKSLYAHMSKLIATKGQKIEQGDKIGLVGSTGYSTGPHLHLTFYKNGHLIDPLPLVLGNSSNIDMMIFPERKVGQMHFIQPTTIKVDSPNIKNVVLDIYYVMKDGRVEKEPTIDYVVTFAPGVTDFDKFSFALESNGKRYNLKNISVLYKDPTEEKETVVSYTSAISISEMSSFLNDKTENKLYVVLKQGKEKEIKISSKKLNIKVTKARGLPGKPLTNLSEWVN